MEKYFDQFCQRLFRFLDPENHCTEIEKLQMSYAIQILLYNISITILILVSASIIGSFIETLLLFSIFGTLRIIAGGFHFDHVVLCVITTSLLIVGSGKLAQMIQINLPICLAICLLTDTLFFYHIPKGTRKNPYSASYSQLQKRRLNIVSVFLTFTALLAPRIRTPLLLGMLLAALFLLPNYFQKSQAIE